LEQSRRQSFDRTTFIDTFNKQHYGDEKDKYGNVSLAEKSDRNHSHKVKATLYIIIE